MNKDPELNDLVQAAEKRKSKNAKEKTGVECGAGSPSGAGPDSGAAAESSTGPVPVETSIQSNDSTNDSQERPNNISISSRTSQRDKKKAKRAPSPHWTDIWPSLTGPERIKNNEKARKIL